MTKKLVMRMLIILPLALPLYVVRFNIGLLPTTLLELYLLVLITAWFISLVISGQGSAKRSGPESGVRSPLRYTIYEIRYTMGAWFWPLAAWLAVTLFAVFISPDWWAALGHWRAFMLEPVMVFIVLMNVLAGGSRGIARTGILYSMAAVTVALGICAVIQYLTGWGIPAPWDAWPGRRATGTFGFPNGLSLFIVPFGIVSFIKLIQMPDARLRMPNAGINFQMILFLLATIGSGVAAVLAKSMGGILAFAIGVMLTLVLFKKTRWIGIALGALGIVGAGIAAWQIIGTELHPATIEDSLAASKKWSSSVRVIIWKESWEIVKAHPLLGTGLRSYQTAVAPYHTAAWMEIYPHPHNLFLMLWIETGLAGLLVFLWIIRTWIKTVLRTPYFVQKQSDIKPGDQPEILYDVRSTMYEKIIWLVPLIVILAHGLVDMPYFKNDLAVQFWLLAAMSGMLVNNGPRTCLPPEA